VNKRLEFYRKSKYFSIWDIVLCIFAICSVIALLLVLFLPKNHASMVNIYYDGVLEKELSLTKDQDFEFYELIIRIKDGKVSVISSNCQDHLCEKTNPISKAGESIICLPNKIVIKISGKSEVDGITQ